MESKEKNQSLAEKEKKKKDSETINTPKEEKTKRQYDRNRNKRTGITNREKIFINHYMKTNNATQAAIAAGYSEKTAPVRGSQLLNSFNVHNEIKRMQEKIEKPSIATAQQVMEFFTKAMNGEIKDQFGLEASLADRTRAAIELAKRTVDLDNRINGKPDNVVEIKLDWSRNKEEDK